ncbi:MAG: hypothetical protein WCW17_01150 [Patescibacteria group bacterium]|jgi:hypothetical protein
MQYNEVRNYAFNYIMKDYASFSHFLPMPCHMEHGWSPTEESEVSDLKTDKPLMLVFSKRRAEAWKRKSNIAVAIMGSPFIHYKNAHNITKQTNAKGTIVFPSHSTYDLKSRFDVQKYCLKLKTLPSDFFPITICLLWLDFIDKKADIYRKNGFQVVSAGPKFTNSLDFVKNFYKILSNYKYASSNDVGSYTFYSIDLGIPFFLLGESPVLINKDCRDVNVGEKTSLADFKWGREAIGLFSTGPVKKISAIQKRFVDQEMGINDCLTPEGMNNIFWKYYNKNKYWKRAFFPYLFSSLWANIMYNGPWISLLILIRKKMTNYQ